MAIPYITTEWIEPTLTSLATLLAAFLGAKYAFSIQNRKEKNDRDERNRSNANLALFTLVRYHNKFLNIKSQVIGDLADHQHRHHFIKPALSVGIETPKFDYAGLAFLIDSHPNLLGRLAVLEHDMAGTLELIQERSRIHFEHLQPTVEALEQQLAPDSRVTPEQVEALLGTRMTTQLKTTTEYMIAGVDRAVERTKELSDLLGRALKSIYPNAKIIRINE